MITRIITKTAVTYSKIGKNPDGSKYVIEDTVVLPGRLDETRCMSDDEFMQHSHPKYQKEGN